MAEKARWFVRQPYIGSAWSLWERHRGLGEWHGAGGMTLELAERVARLLNADEEPTP